MKLTVLGSSAAYPVPGNPASGYLLETDTTRLWIDAGTGTFVALQEHLARAGLDLASLDALALSHLHPDHCLDVYPLYLAWRFHPANRSDADRSDDGRPDDEPGEGLGRLPLLAPAGARELLAPLVREEGGDKLGKSFEFRTVDGTSRPTLGDVALAFTRTDHPVETLALRATVGGRSLVYTADTGPGVDLEPFAAGADLLLCEATYQEANQGKPTHLTARQAGALAAAAGVGRLVLTHRWPGHDPAVSLAEARQTAGTVPVELAVPGRTLAVRA